MNNLILQYYIPYEFNDADMGGNQMPDWAMVGAVTAKNYAESCDAQHAVLTDRAMPHLDPRLDSLRVIYDEQFDQFDNILVLDLDMIINPQTDIFNFVKGTDFDVAMVHEVGVHDGSSAGWMRKVMDAPLDQRGIIAYGKKTFGPDWMFPKSTRYPKERFRYLNGGFQLWSKTGRKKARKWFTPVDDYVLHTRFTEQMYINLQLSQPRFEVLELPRYWNNIVKNMGQYDPEAYINHFLARTKFQMPQLVGGLINAQIS